MGSGKIYKIIDKKTGKPISRGYKSKASWRTWPSDALIGLDPNMYFVQEYTLLPSGKLDFNKNKIDEKP